MSCITDIYLTTHSGVLSFKALGPEHLVQILAPSLKVLNVALGKLTFQSVGNFIFKTISIALTSQSCYEDRIVLSQEARNPADACPCAELATCPAMTRAIALPLSTSLHL